MTNRWLALTILFVSTLQFTLNWFAIVPAFGPLIGAMHLGLPQIGVIVGMFIAGYGIAHIPAGLIAEAWGMKFAVLLGILLETLGAAATALAPDYQTLLLARAICGVGAAIYFGSAVGLTAAWFRGRELVTATGVITGVAFTVGAAIGLFGWGAVIAAFGWRHALLWGAAAGFVTFLFTLALFPTPAGNAAGGIAGHNLTLASLGRVFKDRDLWLMGLSFLGGYGAYFTAAQLLPNYAGAQLHLAPGAAEAIGVILLIAGIPGSFIGGWLSDKVFGVLPTFQAAICLEALALLLIPFLGPIALQIAAAVIGGATILAFVGWVAMPGLYAERIAIADVPTAAGLMLSIVAIGGFFMPILYGAIATHYGFQAAWITAGLICLGTALVSLTVRRPK